MFPVEVRGSHLSKSHHPRAWSPQNDPSFSTLQFLNIKEDILISNKKGTYYLVVEITYHLTSCGLNIRAGGSIWKKERSKAGRIRSLEAGISQESSQNGPTWWQRWVELLGNGKQRWDMPQAVSAGRKVILWVRMIWEQRENPGTVREKRGTKSYVQFPEEIPPDGSFYFNIFLVGLGKLSTS